MTGRPSPRLEARIAGLLYLAVIAGGAFAEAYVRGRLIVHGDAARTAANILAHESLYRLGVIADLLPLLCNVGLAVIFYRLFEVAGRRAAALVVFFSLIGTAVQACALLFHLAPLLILKGGDGAGGLTQGQLEGLAYLSLRLQAESYTIALLFFGCFGISLGWLILRSSFLPRLLGALMVLAGLCYATNSLLTLAAPSLSSILILLPCLAGELSLALWLTFRGIDEGRWITQAAVRDADPSDARPLAAMTATAF